MKQFAKISRDIIESCNETDKGKIFGIAIPPHDPKYTPEIILAKPLYEALEKALIAEHERTKGSK